MYFQNFLDKRVNNKEKDLPYFFNEKIATFEYCKKNNLKVVDIIKIFNSPKDINLEGLPNVFVLKPTFECSMNGVMVIEERGGLYYDSMSNTTMDLDEVINIQSSLFEKNLNLSNKLIVETKIVSELPEVIPRDYKAYCFYGKVELIAEFNRNTKPISVNWYDGEFNPINDGRVINNKPYVINSINKEYKPKCWEQLIDLAKDASFKIGIPFVSIDMYACANKGAVIGEITLSPGGLYYGAMFTLSNTQQQKMGLLWENAELKIKLNKILSVITP